MSGREAFETLAAAAAAAPQMRIGELVALSEDHSLAFVIDPQQPDAPAWQARTLVDLHAAHLGAQVALLFEGGDPTRAVLLGVLRGSGAQRPETLTVEAEGEQTLVVSARQQLVLRCGKASITLTRAGKVLIEGTYVASRSSGVNRIKGGSVQLN